MCEEKNKIDYFFFLLFFSFLDFSFIISEKKIKGKKLLLFLEYFLHDYEKKIITFVFSDF